MTGNNEGRYWNLFDIYIFLLRRVNFTVEFVPKDRFNLEHEENLEAMRLEEQNSQDYENKIKFSQYNERQIADNDDNKLFCTFCSSKSNRKLQTGKGCELKQCNHICNYYLKRDFTSIVKQDEVNGFATNDQLVGKRSSSVSETHIEAKNSTKIFNLDYSYFHLCLFMINLLLSTLTMIKLILYSSVWTADSTKPSKPATVFLASFELFGMNAQEIMDCIFNRVLLADIFIKFNRCQTLNTIAATLLFPSTLTRQIHLIKLLGKLTFFKKRQQLLNNQNNLSINVVQLNLSYLTSLNTTTKNWYRMAIESWRHNHMIDNFRKERSIINKISSIEGTIPSRINLKTRMYYYNLIQFNDCYGAYFPKSLAEPKLNDLSADDSSEENSNGRARKTNLIVGRENFNAKLSSFVIGNKRSKVHQKKFIKSNSSDSIQTITSSSNLSSSTILTSMATDNQLAADAGRKLDHLIEPKRIQIRNVFIARPIHRVDLSEMAWLISMLLVCYIMSLISIVIPVFCSLCLELDLNSLGELFSMKSIENSIGLISSTALYRWFQIPIWQFLMMLSIIDLFNFFSCCLICFSRACYLRMHLEQINELCCLLNHIHEQEGDTTTGQPTSLVGAINRMTTSSIGMPRRHGTSIKLPTASISSSSSSANLLLPPRPLSSAHDQREPKIQQDWLELELQRDNDEEEEMAFFHVRNKSHLDANLNVNDKELIAREAHIDDINRRMEFIIDLGVLIQKELMDVKAFFTTYLNLEISFKVLCMAFSVTALLDHKNIFELIFLIFNTNTGALPIIIVLLMAAFIEIEFRSICKTITKIMVNGGQVIKLKNIKRMIQQAEYLSVKSNRSFVVIGNFSLTLGSLAPVLGWIATGVVLLRR